jgi:alpha-tubulin suppressor-like RCC1 family protein
MAITTNTIGKVRYNIRGEYSTSGSYTVDDIVTYVGAQYLCKTDNSGGASVPGVASSAVWEKLSGLTVDKGEWNSSTTYRINDIVTVTTEYSYNSIFTYYNTQTYICKSTNSNSIPIGFTNVNWGLLSSGACYSKNAFLGAVNEGYSPPYKRIWDAKSQSVLGTINTLFINTAGSGINPLTGINGRRGVKTGMLRLVASGGAGSGFEGVAHINLSGQCFMCEIINPGQGYTSAPTISVDTGVVGYISGGTLPTFGVYVTTNSTNGATGTSVLAGMGDSFGPFKTPGTHNNGYNEWSYINRRHQFVNFGANWNLSGCSPASSNSRANSNIGDAIPTEGQFVNLDYLDGVLPTPDGEYPKVIQVERGKQNTLVLFNNGEVHYCGYNGNGQSGGNYTSTDQDTPSRCGYHNVNKSGTTVLRGKKAIRIAASSGGDNNESHSMYALIENTNGTRELWSWGYNGYGQLGNGATTNPNSIPIQISFNQGSNGRIVEIWAGGGNYGFLFILTDQGRLYACGYNAYGQLGEASVTNRSTLTQVDNVEFGTLTGATGKIKKFSNADGQYASMALLKADGSVYTWGYNGYGQLGHNTTNAAQYRIPIRVFTGGYTGAPNPVTAANNKGTGQGTAIADCQDVWMCGGGSHGYLMLTRGSSRINNTLFSCGYNGYYNLGDNTTTNRSTLVNVLITTKDADSTNATNIMWMTSNQGHSSSHISHALYRYNSTRAGQTKQNDGEWFFGARDAGVHSTGHGDTYNDRRELDPRRVVNNYRYKSNFFEPYANKGNWYYVIHGNNISKSAMWIDLNTGNPYLSNNTSVDNYVNAITIGNLNGATSRAPIMRRLRHTHM